MKSALIIDTPTNCIDCPLQADDKACGITETSFKDIQTDTQVLHDCPLRHLPEKQVCNNYNFENFVNGRIRGWNDYYDMLTKGVIGEVDR